MQAVETAPQADEVFSRSTRTHILWGRLWELTSPKNVPEDGEVVTMRYAAGHHAYVFFEILCRESTWKCPGCSASLVKVLNSCPTRQQACMIRDSNDG